MYRPELAAEALYEMLRDAPNVRALNLDDQRLVLMDFVNDNPRHTPWVGVYMGQTTFVPYTAGTRSGGAKTLRATTNLKIVVQVSAVNDNAATTAQRLGELTAAILDVVWADTTLKGKVDRLTNVVSQLNYYGGDEDSASVEFPMLEITVTAEVRT